MKKYFLMGLFPKPFIFKDSIEILKKSINLKRNTLKIQYQFILEEEIIYYLRKKIILPNVH